MHPSVPATASSYSVGRGVESVSQGRMMEKVSTQCRGTTEDTGEMLELFHDCPTKAALSGDLIQLTPAVQQK